MNQEHLRQIREHNKECDFVGCDCGGTNITVLLKYIEDLIKESQHCPDCKDRRER